ncbi:MAG: SdiA-regulated domain-containing protein [Myxococcota bacterium]
MSRKHRARPVPLLGRHRLGVPEASGVARLPDGRFLVVDDERGPFLCRPDHAPEVVATATPLSDLEGVAVSDDGASMWLLSERDGSVWRGPVEGEDERPLTRLGALPRLGKRRNRGWEGLAWAPAPTLGGRDFLVATHQRQPRVVGLFDPVTLAPHATFPLPRAARKSLGDLNDVTVHPQTGRLLVVSGRKARLAELALAGGEFELIHVWRLPGGKKDGVPEGITYDQHGSLWVVTDGEGWLYELGKP